MGDSPQQGFNEFTLKVNIATSIEKAYKALTTSSGLESWFLRKAVFQDSIGNIRSANEWIQDGDSYTMFWHGYPDLVTEKGKVLNANGKDHFAFTFSNGCHVFIRIYTEQNESIVELKASNLPIDEETRLSQYVADLKGWVFYLTNLKSVLEGGLDLRNKKSDLIDVITA